MAVAFLLTLANLNMRTGVVACPIPANVCCTHRGSSCAMGIQRIKGGR